MVMTVSNIHQMLESPEVEGGGSTAVVESTYSPAVDHLKKEEEEVQHPKKTLYKGV